MESDVGLLCYLLGDLGDSHSALYVFFSLQVSVQT